MSIRRTFWFIVTVVVSARGGYQLAWMNELREDLFESPWQSTILVVVTIVGICLLVWAHVRPTRPRTFLAYLLGLATLMWWNDVLNGISWLQGGMWIAIIAMYVLLWLFTTWGTSVLDIPLNRWRNWQQRRRTPQPAPV